MGNLMSPRRNPPEEYQPPIYTIGHSTRSIEEFAALLRVGEIRTVADIRSVPRSRTNPQYDQDALPKALAAYQIGYVAIPELGGLRPKSRDVPAAVNGFWTNRSFHNYADYALTDEFASGLSRLLDLSAEQSCAIMCAEAVWWRCHRRIVADHLLCRGRTVFHLLGKDRAEPARLRGGRCEGGVVIYPASAEAGDAAPPS
jgi:uncharacterized protein (DUF488 family)